MLGSFLSHHVFLGALLGNIKYRDFKGTVSQGKYVFLLLFFIIIIILRKNQLLRLEIV